MASWLERTPAGRKNDGQPPDGRCIGRSELIRFGTSTERVFEARRFRTHNRDEAGSPVVLTACHRDRDLIRPALNFLANQGVRVYVDFREGGVPDEGSSDYCAWLRECLTRDEKLVLVSTQEGLTSPWTPWQLGLAEGFLGVADVAVLPVEDYGYFRGSPLVRLYPAIRCRGGSWFLSGPHGTQGPSLESWLG